MLREVERRLGVAERLAGCLDDPRDPAPITHALADMVCLRLLMIAAVSAVLFGDTVPDRLGGGFEFARQILRVAAGAHQIDHLLSDLNTDPLATSMRLMTNDTVHCRTVLNDCTHRRPEVQALGRSLSRRHEPRVLHPPTEAPSPRAWSCAGWWPMPSRGSPPRAP